MKSKVKLIYLSVLIVLFYSCTEQLNIKFDDVNSMLVVDGRITNAKGPYEVRLFRTVDINQPTLLSPEEGAIISIYDDRGNSDTFIEISPGIYNNLTNSFQGVVGNSYWIEIQTADGKKYESTPEVIPPEIFIENIYGEDSKMIQSNGKYLKGAKFYMNAISPSNQSNYLRWSYQESWEWHSPFSAPKTDNPSRICYPDRTSNNIAIYDGAKLNKKEFKHLFTNFISENEVKLNYNYLLNISLYSVSFSNYKFWKNIQTAVQDNGGIYDIIPSNTEGNVCACEEGDDIVLGYFEASSVSTMNQIFSIADFEQEFSKFPEECEEFIIKTRGELPDTLKYHIIKSYPEEMVMVYIVRLNECYDCNVKYSPKKPSFWP